MLAKFGSDWGSFQNVPAPYKVDLMCPQDNILDNEDLFDLDFDYHPLPSTKPTTLIYLAIFPFSNDFWHT